MTIVLSYCPIFGEHLRGSGGGSGGSGGESGGAGNEAGGGSSSPGNDSSQGNGSGADAGNGSDGAGGDGGNGGDPALELPPAYAAAIASTGFAWTEQGKEQFEETKKQVQLQDNEVFDTILCLPAIAEAEARNANNDNRLGWLYLKQMFEKWLSGKANANVYENESIFWVDMDWALSYTRVNLAYLKLISRPYLFGPNARTQLAAILKRDGFLGGGRIDFDYRDKGWRGWRSGYFQEVTANGMEVFPPDGLMAAMGNFQLRALARGYTEPEGDGHLIVVKGIDVFIWDSFQFEGEFDLGYWRCNPPNFSYEEFSGATNLRNAYFRDFQSQIQAGENFLVLSHLNAVEPAVVFSYDTEL